VDTASWALLLSAVNALLWLVSILAQILIYRWSGSRVQVELKHGAIGDGAIALDLPGDFQPELYRRMGFDEEIIAVQVRNTGRMAVYVTRIMARLESGVEVGLLRQTLGTELPYRLEPQSEQTWIVPLSEVYQVIRGRLESLMRCNSWECTTELEGTSQPWRPRRRDGMRPT
jgi:hypothetical protein